MTAITSELGLRERKRLETLRTIQRAAVELLAERGLSVTVEEISRRANVSPRTFFNYFPVKEDAIMGTGPQMPSGDVRHAFVTAGPGSDILADFAVMMIATAEASEADSELHQLRRAAIQSYPELAVRKFATNRDYEMKLVELVEERVRLDSPELSPEGAHGRARLIAITGFSTVRNGWLIWADGHGARSLPDCLTESFIEARALFARKP